MERRQGAVEEVVSAPTRAQLDGFYRGRRVFVTGHTGFKGAWLCLWLERMGCEVTGLALAAEEGIPNFARQVGLDGRIRSIIGDIRDLSTVEGALREAKPELVFHLAAQALVVPSYVAPVETFASNVMGSVHVLEAARRVGGIAAIVNVTTDKCYENNETGAAFKEDDRLGGHDPYSASKAAAEIVAAAYRKSFLAGEGIPMATARAGNVIGGGDFSHYRLIPDIVRAAQSGESLRLRHPGSIRPWQHVLDALHGYLLLGRALAEEKGRFAEAFNFGPEVTPMSVGMLAERFIAALGAPVPVEFEPGAVHEARLLRLDPAKALAMLGWRMKLDAEGAVDLSAAWYYDYLEGGDLSRTSERQLEAFRSEA